MGCRRQRRPGGALRAGAAAATCGGAEGPVSQAPRGGPGSRPRLSSTGLHLQGPAFPLLLLLTTTGPLAPQRPPAMAPRPGLVATGTLPGREGPAGGQGDWPTLPNMGLCRPSDINRRRREDRGPGAHALRSGREGAGSNSEVTGARHRRLRRQGPRRHKGRSAPARGRPRWFQTGTSQPGAPLCACASRPARILDGKSEGRSVPARALPRQPACQDD